ncbi:MAG: hypothetical protein ACLFWI_04185 [Coleofasciculus sp.]|uniref:hypothetical protein n=1 Tax=Coleofasciculus sp. TaxID=3100458 RepID=UPI003A396222
MVLALLYESHREFLSCVGSDRQYFHFHASAIASSSISSCSTDGKLLRYGEVSDRSLKPSRKCDRLWYWCYCTNRTGSFSPL